jgi:G3E family GTPase
MILRREPRPDAIVIETSGVAEPEDIVRNLMDPVIWQEAPLETVLCVVDAASSEADDRDPLFLSQLRAADILALSKVDLIDAGTQGDRRRALSAINSRAVIIEVQDGDIPLDLVLPDVTKARPRTTQPKRPSLDRFESFSWTSQEPISLKSFQQVIGRLAPRLARAKGFLGTIEQPGHRYLFQLAGGRATLAPFDQDRSTPAGTRLIFIAENGKLTQAEIDRLMAQC